jgi:type IV pilus biogenesis protein CpaD/CtpE
MSIKVSNMKNSNARLRTLAFAALAAVILSGCAGDNFLSEDDIYAANSGPQQHPIKVSRGRAHVDGCGVWAEDAGHTSQNELMSNHGCAVQTNIAAMTANPEDLVGGGPELAPPLGDIQYTAIRKITVPATQ